MTDNLLAQAGHWIAQGRISDADQLITNARRADPNSSRLAFAQGVIARELGQLAKAITLLREALALDPTQPAPYLPFAQCLAPANRIGILTRWCQLAPHDGEVWMRLAHSYRELGLFPLAVTSAENAIAIRPLWADGWIALATAAHGAGDLEMAARTMAIALALAPESYGGWINAALLIFEHLGPAPALRLAEHAQRLAPANGDPGWIMGMYLLAQGQFRDGWSWFERRLLRPGIIRPDIAARPQWRGEDFAGKTLLFWSEQGQGDSLQFIRFYDAIKARGGRVIVEVQPALKRLFERQGRFDKVIARGEPTGDFDLHLPMMSAAGLFEADEKNLPPAPYLRLPQTGGISLDPPVPQGEMKIGLVYAGNPGNATIDRVRSLDPALFAPLTAISGIRFFSLQVGRKMPLPDGVIDLGDQLADFAITADVLGQLDIVISVDTSVAHLAGALGIACWLLLPAASDWRWLRDRDDSPWYPSIRLFRQTTLGDWSEPLARIMSALDIHLNV